MIFAVSGLENPCFRKKASRSSSFRATIRSRAALIPAMNGAIRTSNPAAIHPRSGSEGVMPTKTINARSTSDEPIETRSERRMPIQSVIAPENVRSRVTAEVKTATV